MSRAERRHHKARMKRRAQKIVQHYFGCGRDSRFFGKMQQWASENADHLKTCSCLGCGNPRRHLGQRTRQELKASA